MVVGDLPIGPLRAFATDLFGRDVLDVPERVVDVPTARKIEAVPLVVSDVASCDGKFTQRTAGGVSVIGHLGVVS